jgi:hypothetical protein
VVTLLAFIAQGQGCPIIRQKLYAKKDPYPRPTLTKRQRFHFTNDQTFTPLVDQALQEEHDFSLLAEVQAYRNARRQTKKHAVELALAHRKLHWALEDKFLSIEKLSAADAHRQIEPCVSYDVTPEHAHVSPKAFAKAINDFEDPWFEEPTPEGGGPSEVLVTLYSYM